MHCRLCTLCCTFTFLLTPYDGNWLDLAYWCPHGEVQVGLWHEAQDIMQRMQAAGVQPNTVSYNALIKALGSGGQWQAVSSQLNCTKECS